MYEVHACVYILLLSFSNIAGYVFMPVLKGELKEFKHRWNRHRIRRNRFASCPCDIPNDVYYLSKYLGMVYQIVCKVTIWTSFYFKVVITYVT